MIVTHGASQRGVLEARREEEASEVFGDVTGRVVTGSRIGLSGTRGRAPAILRVPGDSGRGSRWLPFV